MKKRAVTLVLAVCLMLMPVAQVFAVGDSVADATEISFGNVYNGTIAKTNIVDYYEFTLQSSGRISLELTAGMKYLYYYIYDETGNELWRDTGYWNSTTEIIVTNKSLDLTKGTYCLAVKQYYKDYNGNYEFTINFESANESFVEGNNVNNDSLSKANTVSFGRVYNGQLATNDEKDFYKFTLSSSGRVGFAATAKMKYIDYTLYDEVGNELWEDTVYWNSTTETGVLDEQLDLIKGTYYLVVSQYGSSYTGNYAFSLSFTSAEECFEETKSYNDNSIESANAINLGETYMGQLAISDDKDFYRIDIPKSGTLELNAIADMTYIRYIIYDDTGKELWKETHSWNSTTKKIVTDEVFTVTAGTYYLAVARYSSSYTGNYEFLLSQEEEPQSITHEIKLKIGSPNITVDGKVGKIDSLGTTPVIINGRTLLPIRAVIEAMDGTVTWNAKTREVRLDKDGKTLYLGIGKSYMWDKSRTYALDSAPVIISDRTMLPVRAVVEYFGGTVAWDASSRTVTISYETEK